MPDHIEVADAGGTKRKISVDELAEALFVQRQKMQFGANGSATDVSDEDPLPVSDVAVLAGIGALAGLLTTIDGSSSGMLVSLQALDNAIAGSEMQVDVVGPLPAGANAIGKLAANSGVDIGDVDVTSLPELPAGSKNIGQVDPRGNVAHDAEDSGNPIKIGGKAVTALIAALATGDRTNAYFDKFGRALGLVAPLDQAVSGSIDLTDTTTTDVIAAPGANTAIVVTNIEVSNGDATVGTFVEIFDDATKKWKGYAGALGGGFSEHNEKGLFVCTANKAVRAKCVTTSSETSVNIAGYKIPA